MIEKVPIAGPETVTVPWVVGTSVTARAPAAPRGLTVAEKLERKAADVAKMVKSAEFRLERARELAKSQKVLERLDRRAELQRQRATWIEAAQKAKKKDLEARRDQLEAELGVEVAYLADGLPRERADDVRLVMALAELSIVRLALGG